MAKLDNFVCKWRADCVAWLAQHAPNISLDAVTTGRDAWAIAHRAGITKEAYDISRDVVDAHIQTVLQKIFPKAVFRDAKRY